MMVIFIFSSQPAVESNGNNRMIIGLLSKLGVNLDSILGQLSDFIVRKAGHLSEYFILYILVYIVLRETYSLKKSLLFALLGTLLYSCTDEFHQTFVQGREGCLRDVLIDTFGGALAGTTIFISSKIRQKK